MFGWLKGPKAVPPPEPDRMGRYPAWYDAMEGRTDALLAALDAGLDPDHADVEGNTMLAVAALYGRADAVRLLLERGANTELTDRHGNAALWGATREASNCNRPGGPIIGPETVALLLDAGADPLHRNKHDRIAPSWAEGSPDIQALYRKAGYKGPFEL